MKIAYIITHPQFGIQVLALPGESPVQALTRFNTTILGFDPSEMPVCHTLSPRWASIYSIAQLNSFKGIVGSLADPDTREELTVDQYIAKLPGYITERESPLPTEVWQ